MGERVVVTKSRTFNMKPGDIGVCTLTDEFSDASIDAELEGYGKVFIDNAGEGYAVLEPLTSAEQTPTPTPLSALPLADQYAENITVLTRKIVALEGRILALETDTSPALVPSYVKVAEGPVDNALPSYAKSAQQIRDEIVERAKADVENLADENGLYAIGTDGRYGFDIVRAEFVINREKRTVVAVMRDVYSLGEKRVVARGIARCAPGETFNAHIGRAIALRRALGLAVPAEYLNAPQPEEVRVGDIVRLPYGGVIRTVAAVLDSHVMYSNGMCNSRGIPIIIDDSRAEDSGVKAAPSPRKEAA
ncbi:hypothetical protein [Paenibacillus sp. FSL K6-2859]|uniref:hypothetical protein n=1 Tax=Paenibacillus sp. FSL K6-2859 TaxID=2921482 RepID=UPI0030FBDD09